MGWGGVGIEGGVWVWEGWRVGVGGGGVGYRRGRRGKGEECGMFCSTSQLLEYAPAWYLHEVAMYIFKNK